MKNAIKDEMESFHIEFFEDIQKQNFFPLIAQEFIGKYFHKKQITNDIYEKNIFAYIDSITLEHLVSLYDNSDGFFQGFAGYLFRIHFKEVFEYIADLMLDEISMANTHMIEFLNYYASDIIVVGGEKYKVPIIEAKSGLRWNVISMLSIAKIYTQTAKFIKVLQTSIFKMKKNIASLHIDGLSPIEYHTAFIKTRQTLESKILTTNRMISQKRIKMYQALQHDMDILIREVTAKQRIIKQNVEAYESMRSSLVQALTSKKKKL